MIEYDETTLSMFDLNQVSGVKRLFDERSNFSSVKSVNLGWNSPQNGLAGAELPLWSGPCPPLPAMSCGLGALLSKLPLIPSCNSIQVPDTGLLNNRINGSSHRVKVEECGFHFADDSEKNGRVGSSNISMELQDGVTALGSVSLRK